MAYGDLPLDAPEKPNKGHEGGACNRRACQAEPAIYWNHGSYSWYCADCARDIGQDPVNKRDWELRWQPQCGHPMFETREEMDARQSAIKPARQQGKTIMLENVRLSYPHLREPTRPVRGEITDYDGPPEEGEGRRWSPVTNQHANRQQRRAAERAEWKRLRKRS